MDNDKEEGETTMNILDSQEEMKKLDPENCLGSIELFPDQCLDAWNKVKEVRFPDDYRNARNIIVCGMGGSRFTPLIIKELCTLNLTVPYEIFDDYRLPHYVDSQSLVILSSYSGGTEEPISCAKQAIEERKAKVTGIAKGGAAIDLLRRHDLPYYQFDEKLNPSTQPRLGGGYMLMGHLGLLTSLGYISSGNYQDGDIEAASSYARQVGQTMRSDIPTLKNPAKQLARNFYRKIPIIIGAEFLRGSINGFANQINENAKNASEYRIIPELNHHLLEGLRYPEEAKSLFLYTFIRSKLYSPKIKQRMDITKDLVERQGYKTHDINLRGETRLSQVLEASSIGGFSTFYHAMLNRVNPSDIPWVDLFKEKLRSAE